MTTEKSDFADSKLKTDKGTRIFGGKNQFVCVFLFVSVELSRLQLVFDLKKKQSCNAIGCFCAVIINSVWCKEINFQMSPHGLCTDDWIRPSEKSFCSGQWT